MTFTDRCSSINHAYKEKQIMNIENVCFFLKLLSSCNQYITTHIRMLLRIISHHLVIAIQLEPKIRQIMQYHNQGLILESAQLNTVVSLSGEKYLLSSRNWSKKNNSKPSWKSTSLKTTLIKINSTICHILSCLCRKTIWLNLCSLVYCSGGCFYIYICGIYANEG